LTPPGCSSRKCSIRPGDLFPQLEPIFEAANYDDVPSVASWEDLSRNNLYPAMTLLEIYNGRTPVRANQAAGGMTRAESRRYLDWISGAISSGVYADRIERVLSFIGSARRRREVGKAQLQVLLDQKIVARDADDRPITGISGNVPDTDDESRLMRYELSNFKLKLDFNGNDIIDRFELVDGHVELDMRIPQLSMGANFSTNGLASALGISLNFLTAGAFAIWLDNSGHWRATHQTKRSICAWFTTASARILSGPPTPLSPKTRSTPRFSG
jgi:hypothetical protein